MVTRANGSALIEVGKTKVVAGCYGPRDSLRTKAYNVEGTIIVFSRCRCMRRASGRMHRSAISHSDRIPDCSFTRSDTGKIDCILKFAPFSCRVRRGHQQDPQEKEYSATVVQALSHAVILSRYPKSLIELHITVLEDGGSVLATAISCATLALAHAEIEMYDLVSACSVGWRCGAVYLDPTAEEEEVQDASLTVALMPGTDEISGLVQTGELPYERQAEAVDLAVGLCGQVHLVIQAVLVRDIEAAAAGAANEMGE